MKKITPKWKYLLLSSVWAGLVCLPLSHVAADDVVAGKTFGEWSGIWWQWAYENGFIDQTGAFADGEIDCSAGQQGPVWFLTGKGVEDCCDADLGELPADRSCSDPIPRGTRLFFPLINVTIHNPDSWCPPDDICSVEEKRVIMDELFNDFEPGLVNSRTCYLSAHVDGVPVIYDGTLIARTQSPPYPLQDDPEAVADGVYVMLPELSKGDHTIDFTGAICDFDDGTIIFGSRVRYELTIGGKRHRGHHDEDEDD